jgi:hypothetical protein
VRDKKHSYGLNTADRTTTVKRILNKKCSELDSPDTHERVTTHICPTRDQPVGGKDASCFIIKQCVPAHFSDVTRANNMTGQSSDLSPELTPWLVIHQTSPELTTRTGHSSDQSPYDSVLCRTGYATHDTVQTFWTATQITKLGTSVGTTTRTVTSYIAAVIRLRWKQPSTIKSLN